MEYTELRSIMAVKLKECIRDKGYTKVSFAAKANISRVTLEKMLDGTMENKSTFDDYLQKIMKVLNMTVEDVMLYQSASKTLFYPQNVHINDQAKKQYNLLLDIIDLCAIYY